jgi:hypothetical protein
VLCLGTNDCKSIFKDKTDVVPDSLAAILDSLKNYDYPGSVPNITYVTPPPVGGGLSAKYEYASSCLEKFMPPFKQICLDKDISFVNINKIMEPDKEKYLKSDGIHYAPEGAQRVAEIIVSVLSDSAAPQAPTNVAVLNDTVFWTASPSSDVVGYEILHKGERVGVTPDTSFGGAFSGEVSVRARDAKGNWSAAAKWMNPANTMRPKKIRAALPVRIQARQSRLVIHWDEKWEEPVTAAIYSSAGALMGSYNQTDGSSRSQLIIPTRGLPMRPGIIVVRVGGKPLHAEILKNVLP